MKVVPVLFLLALMTGGAAIILTTQGSKSVMTEQDLTGTIQSRLMTLPELHPISCKLLQGGTELPGSHCFLSTQSQEALLKEVQNALEPVGQTSGWTNDYAVWGAFYTASSDQQLSFGVNIAEIAGDRSLEPLAVTKGYKSVVNFVVDVRHTP